MARNRQRCLLQRRRVRLFPGRGECPLPPSLPPSAPPSISSAPPRPFRRGEYLQLTIARAKATIAVVGWRKREKGKNAAAESRSLCYDTDITGVGGGREGGWCSMGFAIRLHFCLFFLSFMTLTVTTGAASVAGRIPLDLCI